MRATHEPCSVAVPQGQPHSGRIPCRLRRPTESFLALRSSFGQSADTPRSVGTLSASSASNCDQGSPAAPRQRRVTPCIPRSAAIPWRVSPPTCHSRSALDHEPLHALRTRPFRACCGIACGSGCSSVSMHPSRSRQLIRTFAAARWERFQTACLDFIPPSSSIGQPRSSPSFLANWSGCATRPANLVLRDHTGSILARRALRACFVMQGVHQPRLPCGVAVVECACSTAAARSAARIRRRAGAKHPLLSTGRTPPSGSRRHECRTRCRPSPARPSSPTESDSPQVAHTAQHDAVRKPVRWVLRPRVQLAPHRCQRVARQRIALVDRKRSRIHPCLALPGTRCSDFRALSDESSPWTSHGGDLLIENPPIRLRNALSPSWGYSKVMQGVPSRSLPRQEGATSS